MYEFPEKNKFRAREVTSADFNIVDYLEDLYVDLDIVRKEFFNLDTLKFVLNINDNELIPANTYHKVIFSGHAGCGKSMELFRLHKMIDDPSRYCSIFIDVEQETELFKFEPEDLYVLFIVKLIERFEAMSYIPSKFRDIAKDWLSEESVQKELKNNYGVETELGVESQIGFWKFLSFKAGLKTLFSSSAETLKSIRTKVKKNPLELIEKFNAGLNEIREKIIENNSGKDIIFILDGTEKLSYEVYQKIFIYDNQLIRSIDANMICSVPINSFYQISNSLGKDYFEPFILPTVPLTPVSIPLLKRIITNRIDENVFFEPKALDFCITQSGGHIRQLLKIVNKSIINGLGNKISLNVAKSASKELGRLMYEELTKKHIEVLKSGSYGNADTEIQDLLFSLALLKYNGHRYINPLLEPFIYH